MNPVGPALAVAAVAGVGLAYGVAARADRRWPRARTLAFGVGALVLGVALSPPVAMLAHHDLRVHMVQHVLVGMVAPLAIVLGAPVTLLLRTLSVASARRVTTFLRSGPVRVLSHPVVALVLNLGGMAALYLTPLFAASQTSPVLHALVHVHAFVAGAVFAWAVLAGPDPCPHPASSSVRVAVLVAGIAAHGVLAKVMYGYGRPRGFDSAAVREAALVMYYGGDLAELALAVALFARWRWR